ncbi:MAG: diguanylate cyclase [Elusimicrobiota bacterium]|nr:diguanylate cyclase [Elusimicrobiota bacterium]
METRANKNNKIVVIGGGRRGLATLEILNEDEQISVVAVVDVNPHAPAVKLAQRLNIKTDTEWAPYISEDKVDKVDAVLNLSGSKDIQNDLIEKTRDTGIEVVGDIALRFLGIVLMERQVQVELHRVTQRMASDIDLDEMLVLILSSCVKGTKAESGLIILKDSESSRWEIKADWGMSEELEYDILDEVTGLLRTQTEDREVITLTGKEQKTGRAVIDSALCAPLKRRGELIGAIIISNKDSGKEFSNTSQRILATFANQSAVAIDNILLYKKSQHMSVTDGLTGVYNHRYFQNQMALELSRAQRYDLNFSLILIDLDKFKDINDAYGHISGDRILKRISGQIEKRLRETDTVARYGGDEFVVLLPETGKKDAVSVADRIRESIDKANEGQEIKINVSLGVASYPDDGVYAKDLVQKADGALYKAKDEGRNRTCAA